MLPLVAVMYLTISGGAYGIEDAVRTGGLRVTLTQPSGVGDGFQFRVEASVEQHEKAESGGLDCSAVTGPAIG